MLTYDYYGRERLRNARIVAGYASAKEAAEKFGWNRSTYTAHENGQNDFNIEWAAKYGAAFGVTAQSLLLGGDVVKTGESVTHRVSNDAPESIDAQLKELPPEASKELIQEFNAMIRGARAILKRIQNNA